MHILIAPNAFKNALPADQVAAAIQRGFTRSRLPASIETFPVGDGGDGTGDLLIRHFNAEKIPVSARDPLGRKIKTHWNLLKSSVQRIDIADGDSGSSEGAGVPIDSSGGLSQEPYPTQGDTYPPMKASLPSLSADSGAFQEEAVAVIEMANASGLRLLSSAELNPLQASSAGTGDLIHSAVEHGARTIVIGMGGSATVDGGVGILQSLGVRFLDGKGQMLKNLPSSLSQLESIDMTGIDYRLASTEIIVLCDVENPLTGPDGAAAVFGPQKGASPSAIRELDDGLRQFAWVVARQTGKEIAALGRGGTAGGAAAGLHGLLSARLVSGIEYFLNMTNFNDALGRSTLVITGEGSIDEQTLEGKAPFGVALRAQTHGVPVIAFTGKVSANPYPLHLYFDQIICINPPVIELQEALAQTAVNLEQTAMEWANRLAASM